LGVGDAEYEEYPCGQANGKKKEPAVLGSFGISNENNKANYGIYRKDE
jgi:hypothetical protein